MANLNVLLAATWEVTDTTLSPSPTIITRSLNNPILAVTTLFYDPFFASPGTVTLPAATVFVAYVKNLTAAVNLTVSWTPVGSTAHTFILLPGGVFIYMLPAETGGGVTALSLSGNGNACVIVGA